MNNNNNNQSSTAAGVQIAPGLMLRLWASSCVRACVRACVITGIFRFARARDKTQYMISLRACLKEGGAGQSGESSKKWEMNSTPSLEPQQESGDVRGLLRRDWLSQITLVYKGAVWLQRGFRANGLKRFKARNPVVGRYGAGARRGG